MESILQKYEYNNKFFTYNTLPHNNKYLLSTYPNSIKVLTLTNKERVIVNFNECTYLEIDKRVYLNDSTVNLTQRHIEFLRSKRRYPINRYLCPMCGTVLIEEVCPMTFGDDYICSCSYCKNEFKFGGTYPSNCKFTNIEDISPNHNAIAFDTLINKANSIALFRKGLTLFSDDILLIVKQNEDNYIISDIIWI